MDGLKRVVETTRSYFFLLLPMLLCIRAFNLDTENTIARGMDSSVTGGRDFAFGVSVTIHQTESGFSMLVGAPKSESRNHADSSRRGAVYSCSIMKNEPCEYKELEEQLNVGVLLAAQFDRGDELFGQTLMSSNGNLVVCAPRFKLNSSLDVDGLLIPSFYPVGRCMLFNQNLQLESVFSPTTTLAGSDLPGQAYIQGQFGFSLSIEGGNDMIVGCPRCWNERGNAFADSYQAVVDDETESNENPIAFDHENSPSSQFESGDYLGFSVAIGKFFPSPSVMFAVGRPKADLARGQVTVFRTERIIEKDQLSLVTGVEGNKVDAMVGAMFGYAIAAADLNWDGYSDLIVGAPFYGLFDSPNTGRIVAYLSDKESKFHDPVVVTGMVAGGMFGMAISSLGDIDLDGYEDVAVAAPFIGSLQSGEVYIYRGSEYGLRNIASQVIQQVMLKAFGYALANAIDIDGNHYPDLLVGAYQSQRVVLFRSRPVVVVTAKFTTYPTAVDIETSSCNYIQNYDTCFNLSLCIKFDVKPGADLIQSLAVNYSVALDSKETVEKRLAILVNNKVQLQQLSEKVTLTRGNSSCFQYSVVVQKNIRNKLRSFFSEVKVEAVERVSSMGGGGFPELDPIQDIDGQTSDLVEVKIRPNCKRDPCQPDLSVNFLSGSTGALTAGSENDVLIKIRVLNKFDRSYGTQLSVIYNESKLKFSKSDFLPCELTPEECDPNWRCVPTNVGNLCDVGNPLEQSKAIDLTIRLKQTSNITGNEGKLQVKINASSIDAESVVNVDDNEATYNIDVKAHVTITVDGASLPSTSSEWTVLSDDVVKLVSGKEDTRNFTHQYRLRNVGPSVLPGMKVRFWWPVFGVGGMQLLSLPPKILVENMETEECDLSFAYDVGNWSKEGQPHLCETRGCLPIDCIFRRSLEQRFALLVKISSSLNLSDLVEYVVTQQGDVSNPEAIITSFGQASVISDYAISSKPAQGSVETTILFNIEVQDCVSVWIIIVSVIGSLLLLSVTVIVLYMLGFFKQYKKHKISLKPLRSAQQEVTAGDIEARKTVDEDDKPHSISSSKRESKCDDTNGSKRMLSGSDADEYVKPQSRTPSVKYEDVFKAGPAELEEEPSSGRRWEHLIDNTSDAVEMEGEPVRLSRGSHSQTTV